MRLTKAAFLAVTVEEIRYYELYREFLSDTRQYAVSVSSRLGMTQEPTR